MISETFPFRYSELVALGELVYERLDRPTLARLLFVTGDSLATLESRGVVTHERAQEMLASMRDLWPRAADAEPPAQPSGGAGSTDAE